MLTLPEASFHVFRFDAPASAVMMERRLAVVVGSPALFTPDCRSVGLTWRANGFGRLREMAG